MKRILTVATLSTALVLAACEQKDTTAPPAPVVEPIASPTPLTTISMTGSAEFGAKIHVTGASSDADAVADRFTARWRVDVTLKPDTDNTLSVTATDAAGNVSEATVVKVTQANSKPKSIKLSFTAPSARAGELVGLLTRVVDQYGNELPDAPVTFESTPALAASFTIPGSSPAVTKDQGVIAGTRQFVAFDLTAVKAANDQFSVKATAGGISDTQVLVVRPAQAMSFSKLAFAPSGTAITKQAGEDASYTYEVIDLYGNVTTGPVSAYASAPGAIVVDDGVSGSGKISRLTTAGAYSVAFYIAGAGQKGTLNLTVGTAPGATVDLSASATLSSPQSKVQVFARVRDAFGNLISCAAGATSGNTGDLTFAAVGALTTSVPPTPAATDCFNGAFRSTFVFTTEDTWAVTASYKPTGVTADVSSTVFISVLAFDNTPPTVSISNITVNGATCTPSLHTGAPGCDVARNDTLEFDVVAADNTALAQVAFNAFFENSQKLYTRTVFVAANQASATVHFRIGLGTNTIDIGSLVAMAMDRAGNIMNSAAIAFYVDFMVPSGNRTLTVVASGGALNGPQDLAFTANGDLFIVTNQGGGGGGGSGQVLRMPAGATVPQVFINSTFADYLVRGTSGGNERLWLNDRNSANGLVRIFDPANAGSLATWATMSNGGGGSQGLAVMNATAARGWVDVTNAADGDQVRLQQGATTVAYQFVVSSACTPSATLFCVSIGAGDSAATRATKLAAAMTANSASVVTATASAARVLLATKATGEPASNPLVTLSKNQGTMTFSSPQLAEGHDSALFAGNDGDNDLRRYLTTAASYASGVTQARFTVNNIQGGVAVRDLWTSPSDSLFDAMLFFVDLGSQRNLRAYEVNVTGTGAGTNTALTSRFNLSATNFPASSPVVNFNNLIDVQVAPNGCLLASDDGNGSIYAIDSRNLGNITVERIARSAGGGNAQPRGLALDAAGNLFIAENGGNAILKLTPTADPTDCF